MISKINKFFKIASFSLLLSHSCILSSAVVQPITQFTFDGASSIIGVGADNNNNAIAVYSDLDLVYGAYSPSGGPWQIQQLSDPLLISANPSVAMDGTGTGLATWNSFDNVATYSINTAFFSGGIWSTPIPAPLDSGPDRFVNYSVSMNGLGQGLAAWAVSTTDEIRTSFFAAGSWSTPVPVSIAQGFNDSKSVYSASGKAAIIWDHFIAGAINVVTFDGTTWQPFLTLENNANGAPDIGIDANGNAIAIWASTPANNIITRRFNGTSWSLAQTLSTAPGNADAPKIAVYTDGTAIAVWQDATNTIFMDKFDGTFWAGPQVVTTNGSVPAVTFDSAGNAIIGWADAAGLNLYNAYLPKNGVLESPIFITTATNTIFNINLALSSGGSGFPVWNVGGSEAIDSFGTSVLFAVRAPTDFTGTQCKVRFATQTDRVNILTWTASVDPVVSYNLFRDGELIATIPRLSPLIYEDHNRCNQPYVYTLIAINSDGVESVPVTVTIQ